MGYPRYTLLINHHDPDQVRAANAMAPKIARMLERTDRVVKKAQASTGCTATVPEDDNDTNDSNQVEVIDEGTPSDHVRYALYLDVSIDFFTG